MAAPRARVLRLARGLAVAGGVLATTWATTWAAASADSAWAGDGEAAPVAFDIPAQPLASALEAYSMASGVQVLYDSRLAVARRSTAVRGRYPPAAALRRLLAGTGLVERYTVTRDVVITAPGAAPAAGAARGPGPAPVMAGVLTLETLTVHAAPSDRGDYRWFAGVVQADLQKLLRSDRRTRKGRYRVGVKLWVGAGGRVSRLEVFRSSGDEARDAAISHVLADVALSREPPARMRQPIRIIISAWPV